MVPSRLHSRLYSIHILPHQSRPHCWVQYTYGEDLVKVIVMFESLDMTICSQVHCQWTLQIITPAWCGLQPSVRLCLSKATIFFNSIELATHSQICNSRDQFRPKSFFFQSQNCCFAWCRSKEWLEIHLHCTREVDREGIHREPDALWTSSSSSHKTGDEQKSNLGALPTLGRNAKYAGACGFLPGWVPLHFAVAFCLMVLFLFFLASLRLLAFTFLLLLSAFHLPFYFNW